MRKPLQFAWEVYTKKFEKVLLLMLFTTLPLLILHNFITNYIYVVTPVTFGASVGDIYYGLITILLFIYGQVPYIRFLYAEYKGGEASFRDAIYHFLVNGFTVFVFACIVSILTSIGFILLILPGILFLSILFPIPYVAIFEEKSVWKSWKEGWNIGKRHFWKIAILLTLTGLLEFLLGIYVTVQIFNMTPSYAAQIITQIVINIIIYPFIVFLMAAFTIKWREALTILSVEEERGKNAEPLSS
ncbi:hypothetical protein GCM10010978_22900 [Compostibacillus humi]|uniref:Glycerophosphoryl diester phosphodiesterase membrane domain-containing protein n=1 Tax=Compostibacillus humi TaxID=1245525 RepID=A0A8J2TNU1_9BACI|nr:hypothetical protein [Compostibacillus humi]GFZ81345.1 hypothetical protein GCM10010978_22900 [Compostibacillus humi]